MSALQLHTGGEREQDEKKGVRAVFVGSVYEYCNYSFGKKGTKTEV